MKKLTLHKTVLLLFGSVIFFAVLTQCRKDPHIPFCELHPDQCVEMKHIKDHYYFKTGSWWVYEEQNTGAIDSQWVSSSWLNNNNKEFDMVIKTTLDDYDRHRWTHLLTPAKNEDIIPKRKLAYIERSKSKAGGFIGTSFIGIFHPVVGDSVFNGNVYFENNQLIIKEIYKNFIQNEINYNNVICYYEYSNETHNYQPVKTYYAEGVGLIKKELIDSNQVWLLTKHNVEQ